MKTAKNNYKSFSFIILFLLSLPLHALGGALADSSAPLHVIQTEYFDIIFPSECRESAQKIEAVCDDYYLEITRLLETDAYQRFPVTITRSVELLNAYYAAIPYNRIVLYDTLPESSLDMYQETIQSIFYHELTHAVTYNMKGSLCRALSVFADSMNPAWLSITTFWAEGATVSFESKGEGGRLNDPFSTQIVNQSVIEGKFPSWRDVTGSRDTYPGGTDAYMFGSMFASYLQKTYGMSKYADFWKTAGKRLTMSYVAGVFEKVYKKSITEVWKDFEKTLSLESAEKNAELLSHKKSRIQTLDSFYDSEKNETRIAYFDGAAASLRLITLDENGKSKKNKKLLAISGITRLAFSPDGRKLALSRVVDRKNYKCVLAQYDIEKKNYTEFGVNSLTNGYFRLNNGREELASVRIEGSRAQGNAAILLSDEEIPFSPLCIDDNLYAAIIKNGLKWSIRLFDSDHVICDYDFSELAGSEKVRKLILHNLHLVKSDSSSILMSFAWAELGMGGKMLSRTGFIKIDTASLNENPHAKAFLQKENAFAGVGEAVSAFDADFTETSDKAFAVYILAEEYDKKTLYKVEMKPSDFEAVNIEGKVFERGLSLEKNSLMASEKDSSAQKAKDNIPHRERAYNSFRCYRKGMILPFLGVVPVYSHDFSTDSNTLLGMTFVSTNPWGDKQITFSAGYDYQYTKGGMELRFSGGDDSLAYSAQGTCIFDEKGFMQTAEGLSLTKMLWRGRVSSLSTGAVGNFLYGKQIVNDNLEKGRDETIGKSADALAFVQFSNLHKVSPRLYYSAGFAVKPFILASYRDTELRPQSDKYINAGTAVQIRFPLLVPFIINSSLFPESKTLVSGSLEAILFDLEIQKGIPALSLFVQRMILRASYEGKVSYVHDDFFDCKRSDQLFKNIDKEDYSDAIRVGLNFHLCYNTGLFANGDAAFVIGQELIYRPNPKDTEKRISVGISAKASY